MFDGAVDDPGLYLTNEFSGAQGQNYIFHQVQLW